MGEIEAAITDGIADALDVGEIAPTDAGFVPLHGSGDVGEMNSSSSTRPMDTGPNAGAATRPMDAGYLEIVDNPDHAKNVAEAKAAHAAADLSLRQYRNSPATLPGTVPGLLVPVKGITNE